jgi:hypothetical protein
MLRQENVLPLARFFLGNFARLFVKARHGFPPGHAAGDQGS